MRLSAHVMADMTRQLLKRIIRGLVGGHLTGQTQNSQYGWQWFPHPKPGQPSVKACVLKANVLGALSKSVPPTPGTPGASQAKAAGAAAAPFMAQPVVNLAHQNRSDSLLRFKCAMENHRARVMPASSMPMAQSVAQAPASGKAPGASLCFWKSTGDPSSQCDKVIATPVSR